MRSNRANGMASKFRCKALIIVTHLNGVKVVDYTDPSPKFTDGVIALQIHTGGGVKMRWKDIEIKEN